MKTRSCRALLVVGSLALAGCLDYAALTGPDDGPRVPGDLATPDLTLADLAGADLTGAPDLARPIPTGAFECVPVPFVMGQSTFVVAWPSGLEVGDLVIVQIATDTAGATFVPSFAQLNAPPGMGSGSATTAWRRIDGTEDLGGGITVSLGNTMARAGGALLVGRGLSAPTEVWSQAYDSSAMGSINERGTAGTSYYAIYGYEDFAAKPVGFPDTLTFGDATELCSGRTFAVFSQPEVEAITVSQYEATTPSVPFEYLEIFAVSP